MKNYYEGHYVKIFKCERCEKYHLHFRGLDIRLSKNELCFLQEHFPKIKHQDPPFIWEPIESITFFLNKEELHELHNALGTTCFLQEIEKIIYES